jgi:hypothetical protein
MDTTVQTVEKYKKVRVPRVQNGKVTERVKYLVEVDLPTAQRIDAYRIERGLTICDFLRECIKRNLDN